jgi:GNAT superfamily N-acetyltransferase
VKIDPASLQLVPVDTASADDRAAWVRFANEAVQGVSPAEDGTLQSKKYRAFWVRSGDTTVGTTAYVAKTKFLAETVKTAVSDEFRGNGLGAKISELIEAEVRARGFKKVMTTIYVTNLPMIFIKLKQGYLFEGFHPNHEKPGWHEYSLGKSLE